MAITRSRTRKRTLETPTIPHDILATHILPKLPVKSLVRFRCVCKQWLSLFQDPRFADLHSSCSNTRPPPKPSMIVAFTNKQSSNQSLYFSDEKLKVNPETPLSIPEYQCVSQVVNGCICLINPNLITICNLSTRDTIDLPPSNLKPKLNPNQTHHSSFLFGFDPRANEYKVLAIHTIASQKPNPRNPKICEILTLGTSSWRKVEMGAFKSRSFCPHLLHIESVSLHGALHWVRNPDAKGKRRIAVFDLASEKFLPEIMFPIGKSRKIKYPIEIGGKLALVEHVMQHSCDIFRISILVDYQNQVWGESKWSQTRCDKFRPQVLTFGSPFSDTLYMVRGGIGVPFECLSHTLDENRRPEKWNVIGMKDLPAKVANVSCLQRSGSSLYSNVLGSLNLLRFFITDKLDNIYPLKNRI